MQLLQAPRKAEIMRVLPRNIHGVEPTLLHAELDRLDALPVVKDAHCERRRNGQERVICNLWCSAQHNGTKKQPEVALNRKPPSDPTAVPNYLVATERLILKIQAEHAGCLAAAEAARAKSGTEAPHPAAGMRLVLARLFHAACSMLMLFTRAHAHACLCFDNFQSYANSIPAICIHYLIPCRLLSQVPRKPVPLIQHSTRRCGLRRAASRHSS